jgi:hypothetical protein
MSQYTVFISIVSALGTASLNMSNSNLSITNRMQENVDVQELLCVSLSSIEQCVDECTEISLDTSISVTSHNFILHCNLDFYFLV